MISNKSISDKGKHRRHHSGNNRRIIDANKRKATLENIDHNSVIVCQFKKYASELDDKHDRSEKIIKWSRDITIESKRIIFLLHTLDAKSETETILNNAKIRLEALAKTIFKNIANELKNQDSYQYLRSYTAGLQEYIEAITFYYYLKTNTIPHWTTLQNDLSYNDLDIKNEISTEDVTNLSSMKLLITPNEYMLGVADLTGELMRKCINNLAFADTESCFKTCNIVREIYNGYLSCTGLCGKEIRRKLYVLKQSLIKIENVCYAIKIRGSEVPRHILIDVVIGVAENYDAENDEGCQAY
ncbi:translin-associated protein X [Chelonus insularis]|uniref:translin-associated protein X n=1 Tax=Chelonus insularis TaxID=460826 RepID=UPI00158E9037|nr:translin-associated protein X [Chelonus insularis]